MEVGHEYTTWTKICIYKNLSSFAGAIFEEHAVSQRTAFEFGIEQVNSDQNILRRTKLVPVIETSSDAFLASKKGLQSHYVSCTGLFWYRAYDDNCQILVWHQVQKQSCLS